ncbi:hypothetical protein GTO89_13540 [Heliobacterium gestii]|uniref:YcdB/YcdC repeated domain-containing protein n=1 Tax=Heliomicrobium gestii TaxID=2699 RepID=A0A845LME5_HELGE|nr:YcdB/YcdC domain-containing protein [Heliomicrobium gestii]MBM7867663.1 putative small secreted protein [Heliomicrobium gestii]MZP44056.1 hypothetical protein [Heliomicrobium gestii]
MRITGGLKIVTFLLAANLLISPAAFAMEYVYMPEKNQEATELTDYPLTKEVERSAERALQEIKEFIPEIKALHLSYKGVVSLPPEFRTKQKKTALCYAFSKRSSLSLAQANDAGDEIGIGVIFDARTGSLLSIRVLNPDWKAEKEPSQTMVKERAAAFLSHVMDGWKAHYRMDEQVSTMGDQTGVKQMAVSFVSLYRGVPVQSKGIAITIDGEGHIWGYNSEPLPDVSLFPDRAKAIPLVKAREIYDRAQSMRLVYRLQGGGAPQDVTRPASDKGQLVYFPEHYLMTIDAVTGEPVRMYETEERQYQQVTIENSGNPVLVKNQEDARRLLQSWGVDLSDLVADGQSRYRDEQQMLSFTWSAKKNHQEIASSRRVHLSVFAKTGQVTQFGLQQDRDRDRTKAIPEEQARQKAIEFFKRVSPERGVYQLSGTIQTPRPDWAGTQRLEHQPNGDYQYCFTQLHDGIPIDYYYYRVTVDAVTGNICEYVMPGQKGETLPQAKGIVTAEKAKREFLKQVTLQKRYVWPSYYDKVAPAPMLVYQPIWKDVAIDAFTGEPCK